ETSSLSIREEGEVGLGVVDADHEETENPNTRDHKGLKVEATSVTSTHKQINDELQGGDVALGVDAIQDVVVEKHVGSSDHTTTETKSYSSCAEEVLDEWRDALPPAHEEDDVSPQTACEDATPPKKFWEDQFQKSTSKCSTPT
ncbi:unnamed protein product, partial [Amoebophrya sp. A25]